MKVVTYSGGYFKIKIPESMAKGLNLTDSETTLQGKSEFEVNALFNAKVLEWEKAETRLETVILFSSSFQGSLMKQQYWVGGNYEPSDALKWHNVVERFHFKESEIHFSKAQIGLLFGYGVYDKTTVLGKVKYEYKRGRNIAFDNYALDGVTEISWSEEREAFFKDLDLSFARLIAKIHSALGDLTPEKLIATIAKNTLLLGPVK